MTGKRFDPFSDRPARLLRNRMAGSLVAALKAHDPEPFRRSGRTLLARTTEPVHRAYLKDRRLRYEDAFDVIERKGATDTFSQALILWNHGLYYEVHELLELLWRQSTGRRRQALQAMIRAAGAYVHLEAGNRPAAQSMAAKAATGLGTNHDALPPFAGRDRLLAALADLDLAPPRLGLDGRPSD